ncbi:Glycerol uptake protein 1 [Cladobotryum mycophilum]|uniref:Glycerol uptake protein 1 n=1 Tax=Cladobotryum mycophilum TaxID=491253 RepID=A0ABR0SJZ8_9HYPO
MGLVSYLRTVYDLDTLDTRFSNSSSVPYQTVIDSRDDPVAKKDAADKARSGAQPSKWGSPEFYFYYIVFVVVVPYMFWIAYDVSRPSDPRYTKYERFLTNGWIPGRKVDVSDAQYHTFRGNLPYMTALLLFHPQLRKVWESFYKPQAQGRASGASARLEQRASFDFGFALLFILALHGVSAFKILTILYINYQIATKLPRGSVPVMTWIFNICTLFANELTEGYRFRLLATYVGPVNGPLAHWGYWLDSYGGILNRWDVLFNITILRLISFNMDYYWSIDKRNSNSLEKKGLDPANLSERDRVTIPADVKDFSFRNYVAYALYAPLYIAGPILTFNDYISQSKYRAASIEGPRTARYAVRFLLVLLAMELVLHYDYVGAISKAAPVWSDYTAAQLSLLSFFNLHIIWLKLLLPWRLFRLWSLVDGIDPPRTWSDAWLIRYLYVPLGGSSFRTWQAAAKSTATYLMVFTFVALWHDIKLRLLIWGWLIVIFMVPEWTASYFFPKRKYEGRATTYRMLFCVGAVGNVLMMISANLVGFAVGLDGLQSILSSILHDWSGFIFILTACSCLFVGIQIMFEIRESEKRKGVTLKC